MSIQTNIISDVGTVTRVPNKILDDLIVKEELCIGSAISDAVINKEENIILNIGIGTLSVELQTMQCKFVPSKNLKAVIKRSINEQIDPVELELEDVVRDKLLKIYDEVC